MRFPILCDVFRYAFGNCFSVSAAPQDIFEYIVPDTVILIGENAFNGTVLYSDANNCVGGEFYLGNHRICADTDEIGGVYRTKAVTKIINADNQIFSNK